MYAFKIACCALIFIFRLRFPPGISIATILKEITYIIYIEGRITGTTEYFNKIQNNGNSENIHFI